MSNEPTPERAFELFPGFKVPPVDPSRAQVARPPLTVALTPEELDEDNDYFYDAPSECKYCEGWGYTDCLCGGDFCVCRFNGEIPCFHCA